MYKCTIKICWQKRWLLYRAPLTTGTLLQSICILSFIYSISIGMQFLWVWLLAFYIPRSDWGQEQFIPECIGLLVWKNAYPWSKQRSGICVSCANTGGNSIQSALALFCIKKHISLEPTEVRNMRFPGGSSFQSALTPFCIRKRISLEPTRSGFLMLIQAANHCRSI
jgi:hypothetical protein